MSLSDQYAKTYETGTKYNMLTGPFDALSGGKISESVGNATGNLMAHLGLGGFGGKKTIRDDAAGWGSNITEVNQDQYNRYNDLVNLWNADNPNEYTEGSDVYGQKIIKKSTSSGHKNKRYDQYGIDPNASNYALNQYAQDIIGGNKLSASDWLSGKRSAYTDDYQKAADTAVSDYLNPYKTNMQSSITSAQQSALNEAIAKLDAQKAYGYLSELGYQNALAKLKTQTGAVNDAMYNAYKGKLGEWEQNLNDMYAKGKGQIGGWDWAAYQNDYSQDQNWLNAMAEAKSYNQNAMSNDVLSSVMDMANTYTPEEWIAYGAGTQGQYNPTEGFSPVGKRKKKVSTEGINEV